MLRASTIAEARAVAWEHQPDLLLLDVLLPDGSGYDLCAELRKSMAAPIIFLTALAQDRAVVRGLSAGGDDYIAKPFSLDVLLARVNAQLRRHGLSAAMRIDLPPLHLDFVTGKVVLSDQDVDLSKREMQLLAYLGPTPARASRRRSFSSGSGTTTPACRPTPSASTSPPCAGSWRSTRPAPSSSSSPRIVATCSSRCGSALLRERSRVGRVWNRPQLGPLADRWTQLGTVPNRSARGGATGQGRFASRNVRRAVVPKPGVDSISMVP